MLILSGDSGLSNQTLIAALIGAAVTLILAYLAPFSERRNSEVSTLHSESVWREKLFTLASTPDDQMNAQNIELFRTFLSATRGIPDGSAVYDPDCRKAEGKDLDDLCLYFYADLQKELTAGAKTISPNKSQVLRQLCRLLLKSDWNARIHPLNFEETNNEILYKAILLIARQQNLILCCNNNCSPSLNNYKTLYTFSISDGKIELTESHDKHPGMLALTDSIKDLLSSVITNAPSISYPWAVTEFLLLLALIIALVITICIKENNILHLEWFMIPIGCLIAALSIVVWQTHIIQNFCAKISAIISTKRSKSNK